MKWKGVPRKPSLKQRWEHHKYKIEEETFIYSKLCNTCKDRGWAEGGACAML